MSRKWFFVRRSHQIIRVFVKIAQNECITSRFVFVRQHVPYWKRLKAFPKKCGTGEQRQKSLTSVSPQSTSAGYEFYVMQNTALTLASLSQMAHSKSLNSWHTQSVQAPRILSAFNSSAGYTTRNHQYVSGRRCASFGTAVSTLWRRNYFWRVNV